jgi:thiosulfate/3-mercaptopyruvate sulfurtransferase
VGTGGRGGRDLPDPRRAGGHLPGLRPDDDVVVYCRIGERSSHTWFVLHHLLGYPHVRNYDGSWTEWGNSVRVPITRGESP